MESFIRLFFSSGWALLSITSPFWGMTFADILVGASVVAIAIAVIRFAFFGIGSTSGDARISQKADTLSKMFKGDKGKSL